jgi:hypothetical protein
MRVRRQASFLRHWLCMPMRADQSEKGPMTSPTMDPPPIERATLQLYQLYDVGDSIALEQARALLAQPSARVRPVATRGGAIEIAQLPLEISMGPGDLRIGGMSLAGELRARIYDLGILALRIVLRLPGPCTWHELTGMMAELQGYPADAMALFERGYESLRATLAPAIQRPNGTLRTEDYTILVVERLANGAPASQLARHPALLQAALGERRPLSASAQSLATALSYYEDDLILLTWSAAIVVESEAAAREDATLLLEFANTQLLAFRSYDAEVERDLAAIAPRIAETRRPFYLHLFGSFSFMREIAALIADITATSARVENALKVTEDVYWNRVYSAALATLRVQVWRNGLAEALNVLRQTASLLHDEAQAAWATLLEALIILLIAIELVVAVLGLRSGFH